MKIQGLNNPNMFKSSLQTQNSALKDIADKINANIIKKQNFDAVELSKKANALLKESKEDKEVKKKKPIVNENDMFTKEAWAEYSLLSQRDGMKTLSDIIDYAKEEVGSRIAKIAELESFLNGTGSHSDPNMTKTMAEIYLYNYKLSIEVDYADIIKRFIDSDRFFANKYDNASGGLASEAMENQLNSITAESLGLANLSSDPKEIMEALENASKQIDKMTRKIENAFDKLSGGKKLESARSSFIGGDCFNWFTSQMVMPDTIDVKLNLYDVTSEFYKSLLADLDVKNMTPNNSVE